MTTRIDQKANVPNLHEFLAEAELLHYLNTLTNDLKITAIHQLKYVEEDDLYQIGMSRPEQRRLKKFFHKYYPQTYLGKFVKIIQTKTSSASSAASYNGSSRRNSGSEQWEGPPLSQQTPLCRDASWASVGLGLGVATAADYNSKLIKPSKHVIAPENLQLGQLLVSGPYMAIHQGLWNNENNMLVPCCVKCIKKDRLRYSLSQLLSDAAQWHSLDHERLLKFYGVVATSSDQEPTLMLANELAPGRSLWECLSEPLLKSCLTVMTLCDIAKQICDGMKYLETRNLVHGDLQTRNILVFGKMKIKISDTGLARAFDLYGDEDNSLLPSNHAAWSSPECIRSKNVSAKSDIWAFGVVLWELFSFGQQPWPLLSANQILEAVDKPNYRRLEQPELCPKDYYSLMQRCWTDEDSSRPSFSELSELLPECKPEQLKAIRENLLAGSSAKSRLQYAIGDVIVVLDNNPEDADGMWKGVVVKNRKPGLFDPSNTVAYSDVLPAQIATETKPKEKKTASQMKSQHKIKRDMISRPQADFRHTGHLGMDGAYFGDISFLGNRELTSVSRSYDRNDEERSIGYGGSRDTTPLISSRLSVARTMGSESRMSTDSWQNTMTSSDSPRSSSSRSSGNAKENNNAGRDLSPTSTRKPLSPVSNGLGILRNHTQQGFHNTQFKKDYHDVPNANTNFGVGKPFGSNRPADDKSFDLDFGPSLMEEVLRMINGSCNMDLSLSSSTKDDEKIPLTKQCEPSMQSTPVLPSESFPIPTVPSIPVQIEVKNPVYKDINSNSATVPAQIVKEVPPEKEKPATKPKPQIVARKKLNPITICKEESTVSTLKPISPREEKSLEAFISVSHEIAQKTLDNIQLNPKNSPKSSGSSLKSRFSFRGLRGNHNTTTKKEEIVVSLPTSPRNFMDKRPLDSDLVDEVSEEGKEAYRVLVEEGQIDKIEIRCPAPAPMAVCEEEQDLEETSPLKLLRSGVGVNPKLKGNKNGFNRSLSQETPKMAFSSAPEVVVGVSQSFRLPSKPTLPEPESQPPPQRPTPTARSPASSFRQGLPPPPPPPFTNSAPCNTEISSTKTPEITATKPDSEDLPTLQQNSEKIPEVIPEKLESTKPNSDRPLQLNSSYAKKLERPTSRGPPPPLPEANKKPKDASQFYSKQRGVPVDYSKVPDGEHNGIKTVKNLSENFNGVYGPKSAVSQNFATGSVVNNSKDSVVQDSDKLFMDKSSSDASQEGKKWRPDSQDLTDGAHLPSTKRPSNPPPLPPRDRTKVIAGPPSKPRERKYPLVLPKEVVDEGIGSSTTSSEQNSSEPVYNSQYQNPHSPGLLRDKSPNYPKTAEDKFILPGRASQGALYQNPLIKRHGIVVNQPEQAF